MTKPISRSPATASPQLHIDAWLEAAANSTGSSTVATIVAGGDATQRLRLRFPSRVDGSALTAGERVGLSFAPHEGHLVLA